MFGRFETFLPIIKSTYEEICMRIKFMLEQVSSADQVGLGDVIETYLSLQGHIFRKLPIIAIDNPIIDFAFIFRLGMYYYYYYYKLKTDDNLLYYYFSL